MGSEIRAGLAWRLLPSWEGWLSPVASLCVNKWPLTQKGMWTGVCAPSSRSKGIVYSEIPGMELGNRREKMPWAARGQGTAAARLALGRVGTAQGGLDHLVQGQFQSDTENCLKICFMCLKCRVGKCASCSGSLHRWLQWLGPEQAEARRQQALLGLWRGYRYPRTWTIFSSTAFLSH